MTDVVFVSELTPHIAQITMQDEVNKNIFTKELSLGLIEAFKQVSNHPDYKCVILTGFGNYFSSGGSQDALLSIASGSQSFADMNLYSLAMECPIPVISAMQGHGIGGGFVMGLFADFIVLANECVYTTNFMRYGFTPGMGATFIVPKKLGPVLGQEMLLNADTYRGIELKERGAPFHFCPKTEVLERAREIANGVAEKPRDALVMLKSHLVAQDLQNMQHYIDCEVAMHEKSFGTPEVLEKIQTLYSP